MADRDLPPVREVVLTRPAGSNAGLREALGDARPAGMAMPTLTAWPLLAIRHLPGGGQLPGALAAMTPDDLVVFVSPRAVEAARAACPLIDWPGCPFAAVGAATARALEDAGRPPAFLPDASEDSEGLLECLRDAPMADRRVWIIRGESGRELLADSLAARGAEPRFVAVYRRECAERRSPLPVGPGCLWIITAPQALDCLARLDDETAGGEPGLLDSTLLVINERARDRARALGFRGTIRLAGGPGNATLARAAWRVVVERQPDSSSGD